MKFELQGNEIDIVKLGAKTNEGGAVRQNVTFAIKGREFDRSILLGSEDDAEPAGAEGFYTKYQQQITSDLIKFLSENHEYENK